MVKLETIRPELIRDQIVCKVEIHSKHRKLVVRDLKTGRYAKKPNKR